MQRVSGLYRSRAEAEAAAEQLFRRGLPPENLRILALGRAAAQPESPASGDPGLRPVDSSSRSLCRRVLGGAVGLFAGLVGTIALDPANLGTDLASPMFATLALLGGSAGLGGLLGGLKAAGPGAVVTAARRGNSGHVVLVAHTLYAEQTSEARRIIGSSVIERRGG